MLTRKRIAEFMIKFDEFLWRPEVQNAVLKSGYDPVWWLKVWPPPVNYGRKIDIPLPNIVKFMWTTISRLEWRARNEFYIMRKAYAIDWKLVPFTNWERCLTAAISDADTAKYLQVDYETTDEVVSALPEFIFPWDLYVNPNKFKSILICNTVDIV